MEKEVWEKFIKHKSPQQCQEGSPVRMTKPEVVCRGFYISLRSELSLVLYMLIRPNPISTRGTLLLHSMLPLRSKLEGFIL